MKPTHYLAIAVRLFSICLFIYGIRQSSFLIGLLTTESNTYSPSWMFTIASTCLPILVAAVIWRFPMLVAKVILKPEIDLPIEPINTKSILVALVSILGLYFLYGAIIDAIYWVNFWKMASHVNGGLGTWSFLDSESKASITTTVIELLMATLLIFKSKTFAHYILRFSS